MNERKKKAIRMNRILIVFALFFGIYTGYHTLKVSIMIKTTQNAITNLENQIQETEQSNNEISETIENGNTDEIIASIAREKLDLVIPGERIIVDASGK